MKILISVFFWVFATAMTTGVFFSALFIVIFLCLFDKKGKLAHAQGFWWADAIVWANPFWNISLHGMERVDPKKTYVIIANHQSLADIVIIYLTHIQFKWIAKESLFKVPILGWSMSLMRYIRVSRGEHGSIKKAYLEAGEWLKKGISVLFFPEGTRSKTGQMNPFKNGAFKLAIKEKVPILPIYIEGSRNVLPRGSWIFSTKAFCKLTVLPVIETDTFGPEDFDKLRDVVRDKLIAASRAA